MHCVSIKMIYKEINIVFFSRFILIYFIAFQERRALWHDWKILTQFFTSGFKVAYVTGYGHEFTA